MIKLVTVLLVAIIALAIGCSKNPGDSGGPQQSPLPTNCDGVNAKFAADVLPIFQTKCATSIGCHGNGSGNGPGALTNFEEIKNAANNVKAAVNSGRMPLNGSLTLTQLKQINCWIESGVQNN